MFLYCHTLRDIHSLVSKEALTTLSFEVINIVIATTQSYIASFIILITIPLNSYLK